MRPDQLLLIGNYPLDGQESMLRFGQMMLTGLEARGHQVRLWQPPVMWGQKLQGTRLAKWAGYWDKYVGARRSLHMAARGATVVHILDHSNAVYGPWLPRENWLVTCHDLLAIRAAEGEFGSHRPGFTGRCQQQWIKNALGRSPRIVCVSEATQSDLKRLVPSSEKRSSVVWVGLNQPFSRLPEAEWRAGLQTLFHRKGLPAVSPYLLHIGGNQWYKNRKRVLALYAAWLARQPDAIRSKLLMAGKSPTPELERQVQELGIGSRVIWLGNVSSQELVALYHGAMALLFPSLAEGFGWPVIEALACGCPVVTSNRPPLTEIAGADTLFVDPEKPGESAVTMADWLVSPERQDITNVEQRLKHAARFDSGSMLDAYETVYQEPLFRTV